MTKLTTKAVSIKDLTIPRSYAASRSRHDNTELSNSIAAVGMEDPIFVLADGNKLVLVDGVLRVWATKTLRQKTVDAIVEKFKPSKKFPKVKDYADFLRITIDSKRQDLLPSQRAHYIKLLAKKYRMPMYDIAEAFGVTPAYLVSSLKVLQCSKEIRLWIDVGKLPVTSAKTLSALSLEAQEAFLDKFRKKTVVTIPEVKRYIQTLPRTAFKDANRAKRTFVRKVAGSKSAVGKLVEVTKRKENLAFDAARLRDVNIRAQPIVKAILGSSRITKRLKKLGKRDTIQELRQFAKESGLEI